MSYAINENCCNPASYGEICVGCKACRNESAKLRLLKERLQEQFNFNSWFDDKDIKELQEHNRQENIKFLKRQIEELENKIKHDKAANIKGGAR